jgi:hypothetical protein
VLDRLYGKLSRISGVASQDEQNPEASPLALDDIATDNHIENLTLLGKGF